MISYDRALEKIEDERNKIIARSRESEGVYGLGRMFA